LCFDGLSTTLSAPFSDLCKALLANGNDFNDNDIGINPCRSCMQGFQMEHTSSSQDTPKGQGNRFLHYATPVLFVLGALYTYRSHLTGCPRSTILGAWAVTPPLWLWVEYYLFSRRSPSREERKEFQYRQGLFRNVWLGMLILLAVLYLGPWNRV